MLAQAAPVLLVGAGKMGGALLDGWLRRGLPAAALSVLDPFLAAERRAALAAQGVRLLDAAEAAEPPRIVVLAVKPQSMSEAMAAVAPLAGPATIVVSIAAGIRLARLEQAFGAAAPIIRAMPNTPAEIGQGMTVAVANGRLDGDGRAIVEALLAAVGDVAWIDDEALIDAVTAVSGSGPAYVFLLAECLAAAGVATGLPAELAERLARRTVSGAGALLSASPLPAATLRENVTSPKGTTAAALAVLMDEDGLQRLLGRAVAAAQARSRELG